MVAIARKKSGSDLVLMGHEGEERIAYKDVLPGDDGGCGVSGFDESEARTIGAEVIFEEKVGKSPAGDEWFEDGADGSGDAFADEGGDGGFGAAEAGGAEGADVHGDSAGLPFEAGVGIGGAVAIRASVPAPVEKRR